MCAAGCLPFASPPVRVSAGVGAASGRLPHDTSRSQTAPMVGIRGAAHPLQLLDRPHWKRIDVGLGYEAEVLPRRGPDSLLHGPYLELGAYLLRHRVGKTQVVRAGGFATADLLLGEVQGTSEVGSGASLGAALELTGAADGPFAGGGAEEEEGPSAALGVAYGQWAIGLFAAASYRDLGPSRYFAGLGGISIRIPLTFGLVCCVNPWASDEDEQEPGEAPAPSAGPERRPPAHRSSPPPQRKPAHPRPVDRKDRQPAHSTPESPSF
jgi:hypothetical protein